MDSDKYLCTLHEIDLKKSILPREELMHFIKADIKILVYH